MVSTYNEYKVVYNIKGDIAEKKLTKRSTVRISEHTANVNNTYSKSTELVYELAEKKPDRVALFAEAKELGLDIPKNIKTDLLINKIKEAKE